MNLLQFTLKTSPSVLYVAGVFLLGSGSLAVDGEPVAALCTFLSGACIVLAMFIGAALHRHRLVKDRLKGYVRDIVHNAKQGVPDEQAAVDYCEWINENPLG